MVATTEPESTLGVQDGSRIDENDEKTKNGARCEGGLQSSTLRMANNIANIATSENTLRT